MISEKGYKDPRSPQGIMNGRDRVIRDAIHRDILVPASHAAIIDTPEFQRLRSIQQLSTCEYVFPAATHNRFAHSLGAYHLAGRLAAHLQEVHPGLLSKDDEELVQLAALLHDIGHFLDEPDSEFGVTDHGTSGGVWLAERFVEEVSEPVRLHVAAKRYRCFVDPGYQSRLSSASVGTLRLQGGPMSTDEAEAFEAEPHADGALAVRSWDDAGKVEGLDVPSLAAWQTLLEDPRFHR